MPRKKFVLTNETYYDPKRPHLSYSRIVDYIKSPRLYKAKYVDGTVERKVTPAMLVGKAFDAHLTDPVESQKYYIKTPRSGDKSPYALTQDQYTEAITCAEEIKRHRFWTVHPTRTKFQLILEAAILRDGTFVTVEEAKRRRLEHVLVCGKPDRADFMPNYALCSDMKRTNTRAMSSPRSWFKHVIESGYHYQFAIYRELIKVNYPEYADKQVPCAHITVSIDEDIPYAALFGIPEKTLDAALVEAVRAAWKIKDGWYPSDILDWTDTQLCEA
jgi:hypothetical protein